MTNIVPLTRIVPMIFCFFTEFRSFISMTSSLCSPSSSSNSRFLQSTKSAMRECIRLDFQRNVVYLLCIDDPLAVVPNMIYEENKAYVIRHESAGNSIFDCLDLPRHDQSRVEITGEYLNAFKHSAHSNEDTMIQGRCSLALAILTLSIGLSSSAKKPLAQSIKSQDDALSWLNKYGYNPCLNSDVQCSLSLSSLIKEYQKRFQLTTTGKLDESTKRHMNRPRCGNHDKAPAALTSAAALKQFQWSRPSLTYSLRGHPPQISEARTAAIIREAFNAWLDHAPLKIEASCATCKADFIIEFVRDQHADSYPFDGVGGTLAHAFFPEDGRVHFDRDERWTERFVERMFIDADPNLRRSASFHLEKRDSISVALRSWRT